MMMGTYAPIAQGLEHNAYNVGVTGSIPVGRTDYINVREYMKLLHQCTVSAEQVGRLDAFLVEQLGISRGKVQKEIKRGAVQVNDSVAAKGGVMIKEDDVITIHEVEESVVLEAPVATSVDDKIYKQIVVLQETDDYVVIGKPAGLLVHPTMAEEPVTLTAWLVQHYPEVTTVGDNPAVRPGIVHRLDKDASGVLVVARTQKMFEHLKAQFKHRETKKKYTVLVHGQVEADDAIIDFPIDRGRNGRMVSRPTHTEVTLDTVNKMQPGKHAVTRYEVRERYMHYTLLDVHILTGRTHQIRVHMFAYNHPVVGDKLYKQKKNDTYDRGLDRLFLHASALTFRDLEEHEQTVEQALPDQLQTFLQHCRV